MTNFWIMLIEEVGREAAKGIGAGVRDYMKRFVSITMLLIMLGVSMFVNWQLLNINSEDRREAKAEIKEYAEALKTANRMAVEAQADRQICLNELNRVSAELAELRAEIRVLKQKR